MSYRYYICDVFTDTRFGGNPLAVLPDAEGLSGDQMQKIAREFNLSETTFVLPPQAGHTRRVRIFTPRSELPFAGHPNIGTAFVLGTAGELGVIRDSKTVTFEEGAGLVAVKIKRIEATVEGRAAGDTAGSESFWCELTAPEKLSLGKTVSAQALASAVSLSEGDVVTSTHPPRVASVGLPFLMAELTDRGALERARIETNAFDALVADGVSPDVHLYVHDTDDFDLRARMFAPRHGIPEDPATGSAGCALGAMLTALDQAANGTFHWRVAQGVEMGRPSVLDVSTEKRGGEVVATRIGGACVMVGEGHIEV